MRTTREARPATLLAALLLLTSQVCLGDELSEFEKGRNSYSAGRYEEAAERFSDMLDPTSDDPLVSSVLIEQARIYQSACLIALGRLSEADAVIESVLRVNAAVYPDPVVFPGQVLDRFADVRGRIRQELEEQARALAVLERRRVEEEQARLQRERERLALLETMAQEEVHVVHHSRWIGMVPFGVGQFQNGQRALGWTFLLSETALATTSIVTGAVVLELQSKGTMRNVDTVSLNERVRQMKLANHLAFTAFAVVAVGGLVHAQWTFVPERREVRKRPIPEPVSSSSSSSWRAVPSVSVMGDGLTLGMRGVF